MLILTVHGLGGSSTSHYLFKKYIEYYYKPKTGERLIVKSFDYASKKLSLEETLTLLNKQIDEHDWENETEKCILIGHSLGGVIAAHVDNIRVKYIITISSPINDCKLAKKVNEIAPKSKSLLFGQMYDVLINPPLPQKDDVKIISISSSYWLVPFDGRVYVDEMIHPQAYKKYHLDYSGHIAQLFDLRMMRLIYNAIIDFEQLD